MEPIDLIGAAPWRRAVFTTFALSLSFFEAVVLDALMRGGARTAQIVTDPEGLRAALSEFGARRAGRDYEIEPVGCRTGCFHPKIAALIGEDDAHLLVGSGNLTFGGWGGNLESIDHLHPSFAADAFNDAADFFELLTMADNVVMDAGESFLSLAEALRRAARTGRPNGTIRLIHNLGGTVADGIRQACDDLGGARRITIVSPFYDLDGKGIDQLARDLGCDDLHLHAHPQGAIRGAASIGWPFDARRSVTPVNLDALFGSDERALHAKAFEIVCKRGRVLVSGSANATFPGLYGGNVEAVVVRSLRATKPFWTGKRAPAPSRLSIDQDAEEEADSDRVGVLKAILEGERIRGRLIAPMLVGRAVASLETARRVRELGDVTLDPEGRFDVAASGLEAESFEHGRMILRIVQGERTVAGIVSIAAASNLIRRIGAMAPKIMAMLAGTETPADVAAILSWFRDDPARLPHDPSIGGGSSEDDGEEAAAQFVPLSALAAAGIGGGAGDQAADTGGSAGWRNALRLIHSAFARPRGPFTAGSEKDDDDDEDADSLEERARDAERQNVRSLRAFDDLLPVMLDSEHDGAYAGTALTLAHFLADRIRPAPAKVRLWVERILQQVRRFDAEDGAIAATAALLHFATEGRPGGAMRARRYLLARGATPECLTLQPEAIPGFVDLLGPTCDLDAFLKQVCAARIASEQVDAYVAAAKGDGPRSGYPALEGCRDWPQLAKALDDKALFAKIRRWTGERDSCPRCNQKLNRAVVEDLHDIGAARCCVLLLMGSP